MTVPTKAAPQHLIVVDFETHYSKDFSLSKMTTEEYIRSPEFEVIGVSVKLDDEPAVWCTGDDLEVFAFLQKFPWDKSLAVAHNAMFDMAILSWKYGIKPLALGDTLSMGRALHGSELSLSLKALAEHYKLQAKGEEVVAAMGMRRADFSPHGLKTYGAYCINDTEITRSLFDLMSKGFRVPFGDDLKQLNRPGFPRSEMRLIDQTLRMFTEPVLKLDKDVLVPHLQDVKHKKALLMAEIDVQREDLMSNPKLAESLRKLGVEPPMKTSPATGKETFAFSKSDSAFTDLMEHPDLRVQALVSARVGIRSTLEETRTERFIDMADRGPMPVPLRYYGAHTGRWSGCLVADTEVIVLDPSGFIRAKAIVDVIADELVWDGEEFVVHDGVVFSGYSEVITWNGVTGTEDHVVFTDTGEVSLRTAMQEQRSLTTARSPTKDDVDAARGAKPCD